MYKTFDLEDLQKFKSKFLIHLAALLKKEKSPSLKIFLSHVFMEGNEVYYWEGTSMYFKVSKWEDDWEFIDEKEKIKLFLKYEDISLLWHLLKPILINGGKYIKSNAQSIEKVILSKFKEGYFVDVLDKPYLIYDIETSMGNNSDMASFEFYIAYMMEVEENKMKYYYFDQKSLSNLVQKMIDFDGYIIGFNNIAFDNPVSILNNKGTQEQIDILNAKTLDLYAFVKNMSSRRLSLNKLSKAFLGIQKTLESGVEGTMKFQEYLKTGNEKLLNEVKLYCKNDVRMTALLFLYFLYFQKINVNDQEYVYTVEDFMFMASNEFSSNDNKGKKSDFEQKSLL